MDWERKIAFDHNGPQIPYTIKVNSCKSTDLVMRIDLILAIYVTILKFS